MDKTERRGKGGRWGKERLKDKGGNALERAEMCGDGITSYGRGREKGSKMENKRVEALLCAYHSKKSIQLRHSFCRGLNNK